MKYAPAGPGDDEMADHATDYINKVVLPECKGDRAIDDAIFDALLMKTGILTWGTDGQYKIKEYNYTGQQVDTAILLSQEQGAQVQEIEENEDGTVNFILRRTDTRPKTYLRAVSRDRFLIHPNADSIEESILVGEKMYTSRSDLVSQGYESELVDTISTAPARHYQEEEEAARRGDRTYYYETSPSYEHSMEDVLVYNVCVMMDRDGDGIAEMYNIVMGDGDDETGNKMVILSDEVIDEAPYGEVIAEHEAHIFEGRSAFDDVGELQQVKTVLLREALDNIYWQNTPQAAVDRSAVENVDAVMSPSFGKPIFLKRGRKVSDALQWTNVPFVADKAFLALDYMDGVMKDRTGITELSGGVDPEVFKDMKATSAALVSESATAQAESMIRVISKGGLVKAFKGILRQVIQHARTPRGTFC